MYICDTGCIQHSSVYKIPAYLACQDVWSENTEELDTQFDTAGVGRC